MSGMNGVKCEFKPSKGIDLMLFAGFDEREEDAAGVGTDIITMKEPVFASNHEGFTMVALPRD